MGMQDDDDGTFEKGIKLHVFDSQNYIQTLSKEKKGKEEP